MPDKEYVDVIVNGTKVRVPKGSEVEVRPDGSISVLLRKNQGRGDTLTSSTKTHEEETVEAKTLESKIKQQTVDEASLYGRGWQDINIEEVVEKIPPWMVISKRGLMQLLSPLNIKPKIREEIISNEEFMLYYYLRTVHEEAKRKEYYLFSIRKIIEKYGLLNLAKEIIDPQKYKETKYPVIKSKFNNLLNAYLRIKQFANNEHLTSVLIRKEVLNNPKSNMHNLFMELYNIRLGKEKDFDFEKQNLEFFFKSVREKIGMLGLRTDFDMKYHPKRINSELFVPLTLNHKEIISSKYLITAVFSKQLREEFDKIKIEGQRMIVNSGNISNLEEYLMGLILILSSNKNYGLQSFQTELSSLKSGRANFGRLDKYVRFIQPGIRVNTKAEGSVAVKQTPNTATQGNNEENINNKGIKGSGIEEVVNNTVATIKKLHKGPFSDKEAQKTNLKTEETKTKQFQQEELSVNSKTTTTLNPSEFFKLCNIGYEEFKNLFLTKNNILITEKNVKDAFTKLTNQDNLEGLINLYSLNLKLKDRGRSSLPLVFYFAFDTVPYGKFVRLADSTKDFTEVGSVSSKVLKEAFLYIGHIYKALTGFDPWESVRERYFNISTDFNRNTKGGLEHVNYSMKGLAVELIKTDLFFLHEDHKRREVIKLLTKNLNSEITKLFEYSHKKFKKKKLKLRDILYYRNFGYNFDYIKVKSQGLLQIIKGLQRIDDSFIKEENGGEVNLRESREIIKSNINSLISLFGLISKLNNQTQNSLYNFLNEYISQEFNSVKEFYKLFLILTNAFIGNKASTYGYDVYQQLKMLHKENLGYKPFSIEQKTSRNGVFYTITFNKQH